MASARSGRICHLLAHRPCRAPLALLEIPSSPLFIVEGQAPIWRYSMALHLLHASPAAAIAFYDPKLGAAVVASHSPVENWSGGGCDIVCTWSD